MIKTKTVEVTVKGWSATVNDLQATVDSELWHICRSNNNSDGDAALAAIALKNKMAIMKTMRLLQSLILLIVLANLATCVVWPMPQMMSTTSNVLSINSKKFSFQSSSKSDILHQAFKRYMNLTFIPLGKEIDPRLSESFNVTTTNGDLTSLTVMIHNSKEELNLDSIENCNDKIVLR